GQRIEERTGQTRVLQCRLDRLPLRPQPGIIRRRKRDTGSGPGSRLRTVGLVVVSPVRTPGTVPPRPGTAPRSARGPTPRSATRRSGTAPPARLLANSPDHGRRIVPADPTGQLTGVLVPQRRIAD